MSRKDNNYIFGVPRQVSPCKDCNERHRACHDTCEAYIEWKKAREEIYNKRNEVRNSVHIGYVIQKNKKWVHKKKIKNEL